MVFSNINYKFNDLEEAQSLGDLVEQKLASLEKFISVEDSITCDVEFSKITTHQHGPVHTVEVNLLINGALYRAEATEDSFEKAIDEVRHELDKELGRAKDKQITLDKKAGREAKEQLLDL